MINKRMYNKLVKYMLNQLSYGENMLGWTPQGVISLAQHIKGRKPLTRGEREAALRVYEEFKEF